MEGINGDAYGYPPTQINLASGSYPSHTIDPGMLSKSFVPSQNLDTGFQASQTNTSTEIAQPDVYTQNNPLAGDGNPPPAKKRRGRPPGSKNKVKVDAPLYRPEQPKPQGRAQGSKKKAKSSPQSTLEAQGPDLSLPQGPDPVGQTYPGLPPQADHQGHSSSEAMQLQYPDSGFQSSPAFVDPQVLNRSGGERVRTQQAGAAMAFPTEVATPNFPSMPHRQGCPCRGCYIDRPYEDKTTRSGAPFDLFASIVGDAAAAVYARNEEISYHMGDYTGLPSAEFKDKQQQSVKESLDIDPLNDHQGNRVDSIPSRSVMKEQVVRMMEQKLQELKRRNKTFTADPPCVANGTFDVEEYIMYEVEGGRNVKDDDMYD